jgi:hypothetical protein
LLRPGLYSRGVYHAFCNSGTGPNRHLEIHSRGEFENYYDEYERIVESDMSEEERPGVLDRAYAGCWIPTSENFSSTQADA